MKEEAILNKLKELFEVDGVEEKEFLQALWSNYGSIKRYQLSGKTNRTVVVKQIHSNPEIKHLKAWATDFAHQRKIKSYQVEEYWYRLIADPNDNNCKLPQLIWSGLIDADQFMVLEDLDAIGFSLRKQSLTLKELRHVIHWLANFHVKYMHKSVGGLWERGTYWNLATRPQELDAMEAGALKDAAEEIDSKLRKAKYQCIIHGDAKVANFCFDKASQAVAGLDFQYVGKGCGMQDLAYLLSSCLDADTCMKKEKEILDTYFEDLQLAISHYQVELNFADLEQEWRALYPIVWADFVRFLLGWMPNHAKLNAYAWQQVDIALEQLNG